MTDRAIEKVRAYIASVEVPERPAFVLPPRRGTKLVPVYAALAVFAMVFLVVLRPVVFTSGSGGGGGDGVRHPSFPDEFASYSYLTASVSNSPPGPSIALYQQGYGVELFDYPQALVLNANEDIYRRVDVAENTSGDPWPMLLSPGGDQIIVGGRISATGMSIVDLTTGEVRRFPTEVSITPVAWSPNHRYVAGIWLGNRSGGGTLVIIDLETTKVWQLDYKDVTMAAYSPGGDELAVQDGDKLVVIDMFGKLLRELHTGPQHLLNGTSWSPDGALLIVWENDKGLSFVDATGTGASVPAPLGIGGPQGAAWTGPRKLISADTVALTECDLQTGERKQISRFNSGPADNYHMGQMQFASDILLVAGTRDAATPPDRGPWPAWLQGCAVAVLAVLSLIVWRLVRRLRHRAGAGAAEAQA